MKMYILMILMIEIVSFNLNAQESDSFFIQGDITGLGDKTLLHLIKAVNNKPDTIESTLSNGDKFYFRGNIENGADWCFLKREGIKEYMRIFLNNSDVEVKGSVKDWPNLIVTGSIAHHDYIKFITSIDSLKKEEANLHVKFKTNEETAEIRDSLTEIKENINSKYELFIIENPNSYYSAFLINQPIFTLHNKKELYNKLSNKVKSSKYGRILSDIIEYGFLGQEIRLNKIAPDFTSFSPNGEKLALRNVVKKGKLTLVDFWGSWCKPCRAEIPNLKRIYSEFHEKGFNILGVSQEYTRSAWEKALKEENLPWPNVSEIKGRNETAAKIYDVNGVPAYILVDGDGKIIAIDLPNSKIPSAGGSLRGEALYKKVEEILGKEK